ncbi:MAG: hypothetical protein GY679_02500 [Mycoplasma sp.]|nr:hypothetical protein [Mycoplasma sp.]
MLKDSFIKRILKVHLILNFIIIISFAVAAFYNWYLLLGYIVGTIISTISFLFNIFSAKILLSKKRSKKKAIFLGWLRNILYMFWYAIWVILIIWIDSSFQGYKFGSGGVKIILKPIHFITFLFGISVVVISIIIAQISKNKRKGEING